jgi:hypothetical protein
LRHRLSVATTDNRQPSFLLHTFPPVARTCRARRRNGTKPGSVPHDTCRLTSVSAKLLQARSCAQL